MGRSETGPRWEPDTDSHGTSIVGPSYPDATGYPELDRKRRFWRAVTFGGILLGLFVATVVAAWVGRWELIITGMFVFLVCFLAGGFGNATVTARARSLDDDARARRFNSALPGDAALFDPPESNS